MAEDFRTLLMETDRTEDGDRWFGDIQIGGWFYFSAQAGPYHASTPQTLLPNPMDYAAFDLRLQTVNGVISYGRYGAWEDLQNKPWASVQDHRPHRHARRERARGHLPANLRRPPGLRPKHPAAVGKTRQEAKSRGNPLLKSGFPRTPSRNDGQAFGGCPVAEPAFWRGGPGGIMPPGGSRAQP